jgi:hypothetical protein
LKETEDCKAESLQLEELVIVTELEDVKDFFSSFLLLEQRKKRCSLRRLAVHLVCSDGAARVKQDVENAICAGWNNIALQLIREDGWVVFSTAQKSLFETALGQLPWFLPQHFCLDTVNYGEDRLPTSTPLDRPLPFYGTDGVKQPGGSLVCGNLRRAAQEVASMAKDPLAESSVQSIVSMAPSSPCSSSRMSTSHGLSGRHSTKTGSRQSHARRSSTAKKEEEAPVRIYQEWQGMYLVDAIEALITAAEAQKREFMGNG